MNRQNFVIQTNRLILRDLNTKDLEKIYELGSDTAVTKYLDYIKFNNLKDAEAWLNEAIRYNSEKPRRSYNLGIITVIDNEFIGWVGIGEVDPIY